MKQDHLGKADIHPDSFSWIKETEFAEWLQSGEEPFWINGKPGSGKSTLMKYLAESKKTHQLLNSGVRKWKIVHFFFDYRAAGSLANNFLGMIKNFLRQLCIQNPQVENHLKKYQDVLQSNDQQRYIDTICTIVQVLDLKICAFIDGLDEYDGDLWELCMQLEMLRDRSGFKMCLASRPDKAFEESYAAYPSLTMQRYNLSSIRSIIERKVARFGVEHPMIHGLFSPSLQSAIVEKASGVILWAQLVIDEMIKTCTRNTTSRDLMTLLDLLPPELEPLYQRLLEKINHRYQQDAAILLYLLLEDKMFCPAKEIYQAWNFLEVYVLHSKGVEDLFEFNAYEIQTKGLLGNMIDIVQVQDMYYPESTKEVHIRLLHRSLSTYLFRTGWVSARLPQHLQQTYPNQIWKRIGLDAIAKAAKDDAFDTVEFHKTINGYLDANAAFPHNASIKELDQVTRSVTNNRIIVPNVKWLRSAQWQARSGFLLNQIRHSLMTDDSLQPDRGSPIGSMSLLASFPQLAMVHLMLCGRCILAPETWWQWRRVLRLEEAGALDLVLKLMHCCHNNLVGELDKRCAKLKTSEVEDLLDLFLNQLDLSRYASQQDPKTIINILARHGCVFNTRHLCALQIAYPHVRPDLLVETWTNWEALRPSANWSCSHDRDCPYGKTQTGVMRHWLLSWYLEDDGRCLDLFLRGPLKFNEVIDQENVSIFQYILQLWDYCPSEVCLEDFANIWLPRMFIIAAMKRALPIVTGFQNNDLIYARNLWWQLKTDEWAFWRERSEEWSATPARLKFLSRAIQAIEHYKKHAQWPDLNNIFR